MQYRGFPALSAYEAECARLGFTTRRDPFHKNGAAYFALVTAPPGHPTGTSVESWALFSADETQQLLDGVINGRSENYLGKLAVHGYLPAPTDAAPAPEQSLFDDGFGQLLLPI